MDFLGIDIGCTSIKHGLVSLEGEITVRNFDMIFISQVARTKKYTDALKYLVQSTPDYQAAGLGFPSVVRDDQILNTTIEFNEIWLQVSELLKLRGVPCFAINDADAAGMAEVYRQESAELRKGVTLVITLGTGIGSALFLDGKLLPNTELGLIEMHGMYAEEYTAPSIKTRDSLSMEEWSTRLQEYLFLVDKYLAPHHIVLGGGISADFESYRAYLNTRAKLLPAFYRNQAGVIGTAMYAAYMTHQYELV
jgi:polyphosphate glucokinase